MVGASVNSDFSRGPEDWVAEEAGRPTTSSYNAYQVLKNTNDDKVILYGSHVELFSDW